MRTVVVGAGPVGVFCALALARQRHDVTLIDRDGGPPQTGEWRRRGVMQFRHPHFFRHFVRAALVETAPDVWDDLLAAGGVPAGFEGMPPELMGLQCRRSTFETVLWRAAAREPRLSVRTGLAERVCTERGVVTGVVVDGAVVPAEQIICATGRGSTLGDDVRGPGADDSCGFSYTARMYQARPGAEWPTWPLMGTVYDGYLTIVFPQDQRTLSALVVRATSDDGLADLRHNDAFDAAAALIPSLATWTDPESFEPITDAMAGGRLTNSYRGQLDVAGGVPTAGLYFVGDAVSTTNPAAGRGVSLGLQQAQALLSMLGAGSDPREVSARFDTWCDDNIKPWYDDHVACDRSLLSRFAGEEIDPEGFLSTDVICETAAADPSMMPVVGPYLGMLTLPASLAAVEDQARAVLRTGWRPMPATGPTRDDLVDAIRRVRAVPVQSYTSS
ncbi:MAG: hypothetical protein QOI82_1241 [Actinomycetota bacterium]|jgi:2-polyprenyl-6-methoxyphenol hydroxylase-like FAD-dependent oxidoreductase|nr:hypothetical protein [Actinomycetota bacterium]